jgi:predicted PurR-regulated permease PerM
VNAETVRRFRFAPLLTATVLTFLLLWLFKTVVDVMLLLFLGILISLYLRSLSDQLTKRFRIPENIAFTLALLLTVGALAALLAILVPPVVSQTQQLVKVLPNYITTWETGIENAIARIPGSRDFWKPGEHRLLRAVYDQVAGQFDNLVPKVFGFVHAAISVFAVAVMAIYLSLHPALYREWLIALFPPIHRDLVRDVIGDLGDILRSWIVGQLLAMVILAVFTAIGLYLLQVPFWLPFGIFTGVVAVVPFFGTLVSTVLPALFVLQNGFGHVFAVLMLGVVIHLIEGNVVMPKVMSKQVDLPPVLTIMAVLVIGKLLGAIGLVVAVPTLAAIMVIIRRILITRIYEGQGFRRTTRERALVLRLPAPAGGVLVAPGGYPDVIGFIERAAAK